MIDDRIPTPTATLISDEESRMGHPRTYDLSEPLPNGMTRITVWLWRDPDGKRTTFISPAQDPSRNLLEIDGWDPVGVLNELGFEAPPITNIPTEPKRS